MEAEAVMIGGVDVNVLARVLVPVAMIGFAIAIAAGSLLFITRAGEARGHRVRRRKGEL